ncbi:hypothetical protein A4X03_0g8033, partial [Tilletia caries]
MTWCSELFGELEKGEHGDVSLADGSTLPIKGIGSVALTVLGNDGKRVLRLREVLWVPGLTSNLVAVMQAMEGDVKMELVAGGMWVGREGDMSVWAPHLVERGGCVLTTGEHRAATAQVAQADAGEMGAMLMHERLAHPAQKAAGVMWDLGACKGINVSKNALMRASAACDSCKRAKGTRAPFPISTRTVKKRLALVCVDVIGPLEEGTGDNGEKYTLTIVDAATRKVWAIPVATKANALPAFIEWGKRVQNETGEILTVVRSDNGKEFVNRQSKEWAKELGVWWETTTPYTSQQNGVVERWNRTLQDRMRAMLVSSGLGNTFWPHAMRAAALRAQRTKGYTKIVRAFAMAAQGALLVGKRTSADGVLLEPYNLSEAKTRPDWEKWWKAMQSEYDSLMSKETWKKIPRKLARRLIRCRWVFKLKLDELGRALRYKARLVAMGNTQRAGIDYKETFSPVVRMASLRILLVLAVRLGWVVHQCDVVTAYLNGILKEEVFMQQPPGFEDGTDDAVQLLRSMYGLKQSGREWNEVLVAALRKAGFEQLKSEPCIFVLNPNDPKRIVVLAVYVDDILIFTPSQEECDRVKAFLRAEFEITDNGPIHHFLGVQVQRNKETGDVRLNQTAYAKATLQRYRMEDAKGSDLPMNTPGTVAAGTPIQMGDYAARVGSLMWEAQCTRPDMSYPVGVLARKMANPDAESTANVQKALRYLSKTTDLGLSYSPSSDIVLEGYSDADHGGDGPTMRSTTGYVFLVHGCPVSWRSQLQRTVAGSTTESEYM